MERREQITQFRAARYGLVMAVRQILPEKRDEKLVGEWGIQELMAHISGWDDLTARTLEDFLQGKTTKLEEQEDFNQQEVKRRGGMEWEGREAEFEAVGIALLGVYLAVPEEKWQEPVFEGSDLTPSGIIDEDIRHYRDEHLPQILAWLGIISKTTYNTE